VVSTRVDKPELASVRADNPDRSLQELITLIVAAATADLLLYA
jgi:hypothetical protein